MHKRFLTLMLALLLVLALPFSAAAYTAGTYVAEGDGMHGKVKVEVTFDQGAITGVTILDNHETETIAATPFSTFPKLIVDNQTLNIDAVAGATFTSSAILQAVADCVGQAGGDVDALKSAAKPVRAGAGETVTKSADVIVVGAGSAGLAAAISAYDAGASVIVLEKMPAIGGNSLICGGYMNAVDPERQALDGYEDSVELHIQQTYEGGDMVGNLDIITTLCENALDGVKWLESMGMAFDPHCYQVTGSMWPRSHRAMLPDGNGYINTYKDYIAKCDPARLEVLVNVRAEELILDGGSVVGVQATGTDGTGYTFNAGKGVVMATGGFGANVEMRMQYNTKWKSVGPELPTTNHVGATGDGITMGLAAGANLVGMEYIQLHPLGNPKTGNFSGTTSLALDYMQVNLNGDRYVREDARRDQLCAAALEQPEGLMFQINDAQTTYPDEIRVGLEKGYIFKADTIEELAGYIGCDPKNLQNSFDTYNAAVDGTPDPLGRTAFPYKLDQPPYYASPRVVTVHHTMGGLEIDTGAHVLNASGAPIPGFFAAGEVTGGVHGSNRLGGNAVTDTVVFGRIAGAEAAK